MSDSQNDERIEPVGQAEPVNATNVNKFNIMPMWSFVLVIYMFLLTAIGWVAFWDQDFNKPEHTVGEYR
jgi:hypothetical protein